ncbi:MAG TPA: hypothetical protein VEV63_16880 [Streptosporangiaceae bacterium]|nr:hypothetical protein [Streptosporangiaceae bacterium]
MASRFRKVDVSLVVCVFAVSFGATLAAATIVANHHGGVSKPGSRPGPILVRTGAAGYLTAAALDRQWLTYSDRSTCADRAGGDGGSAVRLSSSQVAWFFSDSSLGPAGPRTGFSRQSGFVHNLLVMQTTHGGRSKLVTITGGNGCPGPGQPGHAFSVVRPENAGGPVDERYWAGDGLRIGSRVLRFYTRYLPDRLTATGTVIASFGVRQLAGDGRGSAFGAVIQPRITGLPAYVPPSGGSLIVWGAAMIRHGRTIYVYGWQSPGPGPAINCYLARVPARRLTDMRAWRFYAGAGRWEHGQHNARPIPAGISVDTAFSVIRAAGRYWLIEQAGGLGSPDVDAYPARVPQGPFNAGAAILLYRAPGIGLTAADQYRLMYDARAEPALSTKRFLMISYSVNSLAVTAGCFPLSDFTNTAIQLGFFAVPRAAFGRGPRSAYPVTAGPGPPGYRSGAAQRDPAWFDSWSYRGECPPLHAVRHISVTHTSHSIRLRWRSSGSGVRYQIYLSGPSSQYMLVRTTSRASVTLSHLRQASLYQVLIVPENRRQRTGRGVRVVVTTSAG